MSTLLLGFCTLRHTHTLYIHRALQLKEGIQNIFSKIRCEDPSEVRAFAYATRT